MKKIITLFFFLLLTGTLAAEKPASSFYFEFDQMMQARVGLDVPFSSHAGVRTSLGFSPFNVLTFSGTALGYYAFFPSDTRGWKLEAEAGIPLCYGNFAEDRLVDWDEMIDDPFFGILPGVALRGGYCFGRVMLFVRGGAAFWWEWQADSGGKGPRLMPIVCLGVSFPERWAEPGR